MTNEDFAATLCMLGAELIPRGSRAITPQFYQMLLTMVLSGERLYIRSEPSIEFLHSKASVIDRYGALLCTGTNAEVVQWVIGKLEDQNDSR